MADGRVINVTELVDKQKFGLFHFKLMAWLFFILVLDGYDLLAASLAAPELIKDWQLAAPGFTPPPITGAFMGFLAWIGMPVAPLTGALTSSLFGIMVGAIIFGWVGDRFGRKTTILLGAAVLSLATIGCALATNLDQLTICRFLCGVGIGGIMPNTISLAAEMAPKGAQATLIILMFIGTPVGSSLPGPVAAWVVPQHGWQMIFWVGGLIPAAVMLVLIFVLPESIKFLAQDDRKRDRAAKVARQIDPSLVIGPNDRFTVGHTHADRKGSWAELFRPPFSVITPLAGVALHHQLPRPVFHEQLDPGRDRPGRRFGESGHLDVDDLQRVRGDRGHHSQPLRRQDGARAGDGAVRAGRAGDRVLRLLGLRARADDPGRDARRNLRGRTSVRPQRDGGHDLPDPYPFERRRLRLRGGALRRRRRADHRRRYDRDEDADPGDVPVGGGSDGRRRGGMLHPHAGSETGIKKVDPCL